MPKQGQRAEINTFIQGLITEASPLNFPPQASRDEENFELFRDGTRKRRLGIDFEDDYFYLNSGMTAKNQVDKFARSSFIWKGVGGKVDSEFLVVQFNSFLHFYNLSSSVGVSQSFVGTWAGFGSLLQKQCTFTSIDGVLIFAFGYTSVGTLTYDFVSNQFSQTLSPLYVRDFWGVEVVGADAAYETDPNYRGQQSLPIVYNLRNQSWALPRVSDAGTLTDPLNFYYIKYVKFPSFSETVWPALQFQPVVAGSVPFERMYSNLWQEVRGAGDPASSGFFIIDALNRGGSRVAAYSRNHTNSGSVLTVPTVTLPIDTTPEGVSLVADFAGRAWFAGFGGQAIAGDSRSPNLADHIMFSQLVRNKKDIFNCYQVGDPTSREGSDVVDTDGGYLRVSGAKGIISIQNMSNYLLVFAKNGVWAVSGGSENGFTATNFKVNKISSYGAISKTSVVNYGGQILYWGVEGIFLVALDKFAQLQVTSLSQTTIQQYYDDIPAASKQSCYGTYDEVNKRAVWTYREGAIFTNTSVTKELIFDTGLGCFYVRRIGRLASNGVEVLLPFYRKKIMYFIITNPESVVNPGQTAFAYQKDTNFRDWASYDLLYGGVDAKAYLLTGSQIAGDSAIMKQTPYLVMHFRKTESETDANGVPLAQSSCMFRTQWDWATSPESHKFSSLAQAYRYRRAYFPALPDTSYDNGFETVVSKNKIRGRGRSFALYFETEPGKDCNVLGWNLTINGNALA